MLTKTLDSGVHMSQEELLDKLKAIGGPSPHPSIVCVSRIMNMKKAWARPNGNPILSNITDLQVSVLVALSGCAGVVGSFRCITDATKHALEDMYDISIPVLQLWFKNRISKRHRMSKLDVPINEEEDEEDDVASSKRARSHDDDVPLTAAIRISPPLVVQGPTAVTLGIHATHPVHAPTPSATSTRPNIRTCMERVSGARKMAEIAAAHVKAATEALATQVRIEVAAARMAREADDDALRATREADDEAVRAAREADDDALRTARDAEDAALRTTRDVEDANVRESRRAEDDETKRVRDMEAAEEAAAMALLDLAEIKSVHE